MAQKRKLDDFRKDLVGMPTPVGTLPDRPAHVDASSHQPSLTSPNVPTNLAPRTASPESVATDWEVAESKKAKKKKKKAAKQVQQEDGNALPDLKFSSPVSSPLRIKDLQSLVLYILADGVAPQWIAVQQSKKIDQIVALMVPGMDKAVLESFNQKAAAEGVHSATPSVVFEKANGNGELKNGHTGNQGVKEADQHEHTSDSHSRSHLHILPVKAPGDRKTGKFYSPVQAMLISPEPKGKSNTYTKQDAFRPVQTSLADFIHPADDLVFAEYPVHSALFTNTKDAGLEKERRQASGQSSANGWVDSNVDVSTPQITASSEKPNPVTQGLDVYAIDCEMVLTTDDKNSLARISALNWLGKTVLDKHVKPSLPIKDYFTQFSGITPQILEGVTSSLRDIQRELLALLTPNAVLIGHSLESDLNALQMTHPFIVDTSLLYPHPRGLPLRSSLKFLANKYLKREIQQAADGHDSVEDARAALDLVRMKCEKGPRFGVADANGESIFTRLTRSGRRSAIVDYGNPERGFGQRADVKIAGQNDDEIAERVVTTLVENKDESKKMAFVWARFRDLESARGWDSNRDRHSDTYGVTAPAARVNELQQASQKTMNRLWSIYKSLPPSAVLIIYPGPGDIREVLRLQDMHKEYQREFKVKKWDELSMQWTDNEEQALRKAFEVARQGWALVGIK